MDTAAITKNLTCQPRLKLRASGKTVNMGRDHFKDGSQPAGFD
jgi:hypothetical protein